MLANANVNETALPKWISLWALYPDAHAGWSWGESTAISWTPKWSEDEKLDKLCMVNSEVCRKPKYPREQAAQNMQWSRRWRSKDRQITSIKSSVMGSWLEEEEPWQCLMPRITRWRWQQFTCGLGTPCSMWRALTPDKYTLMEECWMVLARKVTKRQSVHSSVGQGDPEGCNFPSWQQKEINFVWGEANE